MGTQCQAHQQNQAERDHSQPPHIMGKAFIVAWRAWAFDPRGLGGARLTRGGTGWGGFHGHTSVLLPIIITESDSLPQAFYLGYHGRVM